MYRVTIGKLKLLGVFCLLGALAGIIFQLLREGLVDYQALVVGVVLGLGF